MLCGFDHVQVKPIVLCIPLPVCTSPQHLVLIGQCMVILGVTDELMEVRDKDLFTLSRKVM